MMQRELGRLTLLAEDTNLLAVLLWHLPLRDCLSLSSVCSQLCKQVTRKGLEGVYSRMQAGAESWQAHWAAQLCMSWYEVSGSGL
jgi:hypothetical protein